ncbi:unnamed protein product [Tilletia laevis]|nr:unnamed protein product [Tilletia laevis]
MLVSFLLLALLTERAITSSVHGLPVIVHLQIVPQHAVTAFHLVAVPQHYRHDLSPISHGSLRSRAHIEWDALKDVGKFGGIMLGSGSVAAAVGFLLGYTSTGFRNI